MRKTHAETSSMSPATAERRQAGFYSIHPMLNLFLQRHKLHVYALQTLVAVGL